MWDPHWQILKGLSWLSLWAFKLLRLDMTLNRSCFDLKRTITGLGSPSLAFLRCFKRWLTSMSVVWSGGSSFRMSLARSTIMPVVSSVWPSSSLGSGRPEMRRLLRRPYCSSASLSSRNFLTSTWREEILASRSITWALNDLTSFCRDPMLPPAHPLGHPGNVAWRVYPLRQQSAGWWSPACPATGSWWPWCQEECCHWGVTMAVL